MLKQGNLRAEKEEFEDGSGCCVWYPMEDEESGVCFDFPIEDLDDLIILLNKLRDE